MSFCLCRMRGWRRTSRTRRCIGLKTQIQRVTTTSIHQHRLFICQISRKFSVVVAASQRCAPKGSCTHGWHCSEPALCPQRVVHSWVAFIPIWQCIPVSERWQEAWRPSTDVWPGTFNGQRQDETCRTSSWQCTASVLAVGWCFMSLSAQIGYIMP